MLVLTRKQGETIRIGSEIAVTVSQISGNRVKICIQAPRECPIRREEVVVEPGNNCRREAAVLCH